MKKHIAIIFSALAALACTGAMAQASVGIASGQQSGTNYPMAADISKVCSSNQLKINNVVSDGSLDNIMKITTDRNTQFGIIQADALAYQKGIDPQMMKKIVMVFPFFSTEVHLVVKDGSPIKSLADLANKRVVEGPEGSGTWVTVQMIKALTGINWIPLPMSQKAGIDAVVSGAVDAEFIVAGMPVKLISETKGVKLVSISHPKLDSFGLYTKATIPSGGPDGAYPFLKNSLQTYKVDNVLATFDYKNSHQEVISGLVGCITKNIGRLQSEDGFHAKWKDVSITDIDRIQWPAHAAAAAAIKRNTKK